MSSTNFIVSGDVRTRIRAQIVDHVTSAAVDISTATTQEFCLRHVTSGVEKTFTTTFETDGTDGRIDYFTVTGDLDTAADVGIWEFQAHYILSGGEDRRSEIVLFRVLRSNC